jgi:hypothetical protein
MCVSCGCGKYDDDHNDDRHLTMTDLQDAADAAEIDLNEVAQNIQEAVQQKQGGQSMGQQQRKAS